MGLTKTQSGGLADDAKTTINNNADNRVITGSGTANTLEGESVLTFDSSTDTLQIHQQNNSNHPALKVLHRGGASSNISAHFQTYGGTNDVVITHGGQLGIGTTAPLKTLTTKAGSNTHAFYIAADNDATDGWGFQADSSSGALKIDRSIDNNFGYRRATFHQDGGLCFGSDTAAANALDDYEEGTWTPHVDGWDTYSPYSGVSYNYNWYVKIGQLVHVGWKLYIQNLTTVSSDAHIRITGLPFAYNSNAAGPVGHVRFDIPEFGMSGYPLLYVGGGGTILYMYKHINGGNNLVAINAAANRSNVWCMGTATYATS